MRVQIWNGHKVFLVATCSNFPRIDQLSCGISGPLPRLSTATQAHMNRLIPISIVIDNMVCPAVSRPWTKRHMTLKWLIILPRLTSQVHETLHVQTLPWYNITPKINMYGICHLIFIYIKVKTPYQSRMKGFNDKTATRTKQEHTFLLSAWTKYVKVQIAKWTSLLGRQREEHEWGCTVQSTWYFITPPSAPTGALTSISSIASFLQMRFQNLKLLTK